MKTYNLREDPSGVPFDVQVPTDTDDLANKSTVNGGAGNLTQALDSLNTGQGVIVRESFTAAQGTTAIVTPNTAVLAPIVEFANPSAALYYSARLDCEQRLDNAAAAGDGLINYQIEVSIDGGAWMNANGGPIFAEATITMTAGANLSATRWGALQLLPILGSALGIPAGGAASLRFRATATGAGQPVGSSMQIQSNGSPPATLVLSATERRAA